MLAGLVKSPSRLAPNRNPEGAEKRAQIVLAAMADAKFITEAQAQASIGHPSYNVKPAGAGTVNYVADWIGEVLDDLVGQIDQNIVVETTIDPKLQSVAEAAVIDELAAKSVKFNVSQGALVAMTPDGAVRAMVGGRNYAESQYNRAVTAKRQPGSAFKPFVYLTAIEAGLTPETIRQDAPLDVKGWKPENYSHEYFGAVTLTQALAMSLNTVAVRLGLEVGAKNVVRTAHRLGISSKLDANASIALGTSEVSLLELVGAYAPFANGGLGVSPHVVTRIRTSEGKVLYTRPADQLGQVIEPRNVAVMNTMMQETLLSGTAQQGGTSGLDGRRQDRHQPGFPRRLVHRLHRQSRHRRLARQRRQFADQEGDRRRPAGGSLDPLHESRASGRDARTAAEFAAGWIVPEHGASFLASRLALGAHSDADVRKRCGRPASADANLGAAGSGGRPRRLADGTAVRTVEFPSTAKRPGERPNAAFAAD